MNAPQCGSKELSKQLEYAKQQQQLKALGSVLNSTNSKAISAESMIEDLLSKKETFQKRSQETNQKQDYNTWQSGVVPPLYERVWLGVQTAGGLADTPLLSSLLMSSGLPTETLGYIWSLANQMVPGALTESEVYMVLALVGLAQTGYIVHNADILHHLTHAPVPTLDLTLLPTRATGPHIYPNPLNVTTLPNSKSFSWLSSEIAYSATSDKIGISYLSNEPMVSPKLLTDKVANGSTIAVTDNTASINVGGHKTVSSSNLSMSLGFDSESTAKKKAHSSDTFSFSFPCVNESPSHLMNIRSENIDPFDDEFTDFQSADFSSVAVAAPIEDNHTIANEDEFSNFQKASPKFESDDFSVLVVGGKNIQSAQQLWVTESPSVHYGLDNCSGMETGISVSSVVPELSGKDIQENVINPIGNMCKRDTSECKYDAFQDIDDDKYSVFYNPLPEDEDKQSIASGTALESTLAEPKSIFKHSLFDDPEPSLGFSKTDQQIPSLDFSKLGSDGHYPKKSTSENDDDEYCNFQTFPVSFPQTDNSDSTDKTDKYDVFRTIIFQDTAFGLDAVQKVDTEGNTRETLAQMQSVESEIEIIKNIENTRKDDYDLFKGIPEKQTFDNTKFDNFHKTTVLVHNKDSDMHSLFSSLAIKDKNSEEETKHDSPLTLGPAEDKYKALRLLEETNSETDDFGEFLGAELPNSGNAPQPNVEQASVQIRCLEACLNLLKAGLFNLSRASSAEVVSEILSDPRANTYLDCLLEVYRVSERILHNLNSDVCASTRAEILEVWQSLAPFFSHSEHNHLAESVGAMCGVCRSNTGPAPITFGALSFHSPCANLYLHCVEPILPNIAAVQ